MHPPCLARLPRSQWPPEASGRLLKTHCLHFRLTVESAVLFFPFFLSFITEDSKQRLAIPGRECRHG